MTLQIQDMGNTLAEAGRLLVGSLMPWSTTNMDDLRREFVTKALMGTESFQSLCRQYGISRKTGYKWRDRAITDGLQGVMERSRRPHRSPQQLDEATTCALIKLKMRHPSWGPKKLCTLYARQYGGAPSASSCQRVLTKAGLVQPRRKRVRTSGGRVNSLISARAPNDVWTVDFKGWWRLRDGDRCEPLTVRDAFSRYVLAARVVRTTSAQAVFAEFRRLFECYGLPKVIKSDNGSPFASHALLGLSRLSAWWIALGIELDRSRPAHPQDNGAHERLHRDMQHEVAQHVQADALQQQAACDLWREEYNHVRPHERLGNQTPASVYRKSERRYRTEPFELEYGPGLIPRKVCVNGTIKWDNHPIFLTTALAGWQVGVRLTGPDTAEVWFNYLLLGSLELSTLSFRGLPSQPAEAQRSA